MPATICKDIFLVTKIWLANGGDLLDKGSREYTDAEYARRIIGQMF